MTGNEFEHCHKKLAIRSVSVYIAKMRKRQRIDSWLVSYGIYMLCTVLAVSSFISVAYAQRATETNDETAMAIPHLVFPGTDRIDFPRPLSPSDVALIKDILNIQTNGAVLEADREIAHLEADWMVGPIFGRSASYFTSYSWANDHSRRMPSMNSSMRLRHSIRGHRVRLIARYPVNWNGSA